MKKVKFDIEKAKAGAKLVTRNGKPARIICWDIKRKDYTLAGAIDEGGVESLCFYTNSGRSWAEGDSCDDLFVLEEPTIRPYANAEEVLKDMREHGSMVLFNENNCYYHIMSLSNDDVEICNNYNSFDEFKDKYIWQDGHPCGVEEE